MNNNIPIRQHYIPQFILKNFSNDNKTVKYFDIVENKNKIIEIRNVFMEKHFYDDKINHIDFPQKIENDLSKYESEIAPIIKRFLEKDSFYLTTEENEKLKLFFAIMAFRNKNAKLAIINYSDDTIEKFKQYQNDLNFEDFWKRNLGYIVNCRSITEVLRHKEIDVTIKNFMLRDCFGLKGIYFLLYEKRGDISFIIGDAYPTDIRGDNKIHCYSYFPISPDRLVLVVSKGVEYVPNGILDFSKNELKHSVNQLYISVKKIYEDKIILVNKEIKECSKTGYIYEV